MAVDRLWEVVLAATGGGGLPVTEGEDTESATVGRLAKGAIVREAAPPSGSRHHPEGRRIRFSKISGSGPESGWVTTSRREKDFLVRTYDVAQAGEVAPADCGAPLAKPADGVRPYDVIIYGASGFTGSLAAEHLDALVRDGLAGVPGGAGAGALRWAMAARSPSKLRPLERRCKSGPTVFRAETPEDVSLLAANCRVLIAAAGPYQLIGEAAVKACVDNGTHYVDVTGETTWVREMVDLYHDRAREQGVMLVFCAGQVCTIDEVSCYLLAKKLGPLKRFREYFSSVGGMTGGTFATNVATFQRMTPQAFELYRDPFNVGGQRKCGLREEDKDCTVAEQDPLFPAFWLHPAYNSTTGSRIIRRSVQLFEESPVDELRYGDEISVTIREGALSQKAAQEKVQSNAMPASLEAALAAAQYMQMQVASGQVPKPGQGPPAEMRARYYSDVYAVGESEDGRWAHVHYMGPEAYEVTAMCCVTAALCLAQETERLRPDRRGGCLTPAFALHGSTFVQRLEAAGFANGGGRKMRFEVLDGKPTEDALKKAITDKTKEAILGQVAVAEGKLKAFV